MLEEEGACQDIPIHPQFAAWELGKRLPDDAILACDLRGLGESMNECMRCWEAILPGTVRHPTLTVDLAALLGWYQSRYPGAM